MRDWLVSQVSNVAGDQASGVLLELMTPGSPFFNMALAPVVVYWSVVLVYEILDHIDHPRVNRHRIARTQEGRGNMITRWQCFQRVVLQQVLQTLLGMFAMFLDPQQCVNNPHRGFLQGATHFVIGMFVMDAWQYWIHRWMHDVKFLYKHIHSVHHKLYMPYAMGALYNHPLEALLLDTVSAGLSMYVSGMSCETATWFFALSTMKTVFDHCNYRGILNPIHCLFPNRAAYHDVHHDIRGIKSNYSQPFFIHWDIMMGTYQDPVNFHLSQAEVDEKLGITHTSVASKSVKGASNKQGSEDDTSSSRSSAESHGPAVDDADSKLRNRKARALEQE